MVEKIQNFLEHEHTPLEKGLLISVALLAGIIIGFLAAPIKNGIQMWSENGNGNGCNNTGAKTNPNAKLKKDNTPKSKLSCCHKAHTNN